MERAIRYIREAFFAGRRFTDLDDLNAQAEAWTHGPAALRRCPEDETLTVKAAFAAERERLLGLPPNAFPADEVKAVSVGKTPYVRFDLNDYSVPHAYVQRALTVVADPNQVRVLDGTEVIADHRRSYDRAQQIELPAHIDALVAQKHQASAHRGTDRLVQAVPQSRELLRQAAERGEPLGRLTRSLLELLDRYGVTELAAAITDALAREVPHPNAVRLALERRRQAQDVPPPIGIALPDHVKRRDVPVRPHALAGYDQLTEAHDDDA